MAEIQGIKASLEIVVDLRELIFSVWRKSEILLKYPLNFRLIIIIYFFFFIRFLQHVKLIQLEYVHYIFTFKCMNCMREEFT